MPITYQWADAEHTVMQFTVTDPFSMEDYYKMRPHSDRALREAGHPVGAVFIIPRTTKLSPHALFHTRFITTTVPENLVITVAVTDSTLYRSFLDLAHRLIPHSTKTLIYADDLEEAQALIAARLAEAARI
jgi:hypothetical protein